MAEKGLSERERVEWLLGFLRRDISSLSDGELIDLREKALQFRDPRPALDRKVALARIEDLPDHRFDEPGLVIAGTLEEITQSARDLLVPIQQRLRAGIDALDDADGYWVVSAEDAEKRPKIVLERCRDGQVRRRLSGDFEEVFLAYAADLLERWWLQLRRCKYEECRAWFLPRHGRQLYHNSACSGIRRQQKYRAEHGRDYAAEYDERARRKYGPNVKVQRRSRKTKKQSSARRKRDKGGTK